MDAKTRRILITVCVVAFLLTSTFTWGVLQVGWDVTKIIGDWTGEKVEDVRGLTQWGVAWVLAHANLLVPVLFLGGIIWLVRQKPKD